MEKFSNKELEIISNGLISLIVNAANAKRLVTDTASQNSIDDYMKTLQALNSKVCKMETDDKTEEEISRQSKCCLGCNFYDMNDQINAFGTCEPQDQDFHCTHECNLSEEELKELEGLTGHSR
ncbi:hypothetical protein [Acetobacterium wieringae]|uniref:hypothetical protein n=1 Tax=Acetobacterium wieringae TaxID=52694 RepID=UPI0026F16227|nr:hypothetical protein [Acetobacterium wieringae]